jgi:ATP-dependent Clp protease ATP-binding subunit ClpB
MDQVNRLLKTHFRPEFLNRIDEIVTYKPLNEAQITEIVKLMLKGLNDRLEARHLRVELTDAAMARVIGEGFDPVYGARPLKRYLQSHVETLVARRIVAGDIRPGDVITVDAGENGLFIA